MRDDGVSIALMPAALHVATVLDAKGPEICPDKVPNMGLREVLDIAKQRMIAHELAKE